MLICSMFVSNGPLAQSVERGGRVSVRHSYGPKFTFNLYFFLFLDSLRVFILKNVNLLYVSIKCSVSSVGRAWY